jgi:aerobic-type carbon monoxide dehydrogenase small subunit (CoxS/CutS family)
MEELIQFKLNGKQTKIKVDPDRMLLWVLRTNLELTGTKFGCGEGYCGSCTVLINQKAERACSIPVKEIMGKDVVTIEGLEKNGKLHPLQKAFMQHDALQCGYCTPGMIMTAYSFLHENPKPSYSEIVKAMDNNLCRCGAHTRIIKAIQTAAEQSR